MSETSTRPETGRTHPLAVLGGLLLACALSGWLGLALAEGSPPQAGPANAALILIVYGALGLAGYWLARHAGLPGILAPSGNWRRWLLIPFAAGLALGIVLVFIERSLAASNGTGFLPHPAFPVSIAAVLSAAIGEEIVFRGFVLSLSAAVLQRALARWESRRLNLWVANLAAALAFGAVHLPVALSQPAGGAAAPASALLVVEVLLLNGLLGLTAGERYIKDGLLAAISLHLGAAVLWSVIFPLLPVR